MADTVDVAISIKRLADDLYRLDLDKCGEPVSVSKAECEHA